MGTTIRATTSSPVKMYGFRLNVRWSGELNEVDSVLELDRSVKRLGRPSSAEPRTWYTPMVATVRMRRGAVTKRWMITRSTSHPVATATARPRITAAQ